MREGKEGKDGKDGEPSEGVQLSMSSVALSAVLDKHIRRLCLDQFPCGKGSWVSEGVDAVVLAPFLRHGATNRKSEQQIGTKSFF